MCWTHVESTQQERPIARDREFGVVLSAREEAHLWQLYFGVGHNPKVVYTDVLLTRENIDRFLVMPTVLSLLGAMF